MGVYAPIAVHQSFASFLKPFWLNSQRGSLAPGTRLLSAALSTHGVEAIASVALRAGTFYPTDA